MSENGNMRRLPVYLLIDTSGSMAGEPIEACRQGVKALLADLRGDPQALETAALSVITFADRATQTAPLCDLMEFNEPMLAACGSTYMGQALTLTAAAIDREVRKSTPTQKGDWKPLVFLLTDGCPSDDIAAGAAALRACKANVIACAAGAGADVATLKQITESVVMLSSLEPDQLKAFFKWISSSVKTTSTKLTGSPAATQLPPMPAAFTIVP